MSDREKLLKLVADFDCCILTTVDHDGVPHSRPMIVAECGEAGSMLFVTGKYSPKVEELKKTPVVSVSFQDGRAKAVCFSGKAELRHDVAKLKELWNTNFDAWFPDGPEGKDVGLLAFTPMAGEYWDSSGLKALDYLFETVKASLTDTKPSLQDDAHGSVKF